jgi:hypothetical protein
MVAFFSNIFQAEWFIKSITFGITSLAILTQASGCTIPFFNFNNRRTEIVYGILKKDPSIREEGYVRANAVKSGDQVNQTALSNISGIKLVRYDQDNLFFLTKEKGLFKSTDAGVIWERKYLFPVGSSKENETDRNNEINSQITRNDQFSVTDLTVSNRNRDLIYVSGIDNDKIGKIFKSTDSGQSFKVAYSEVMKDVAVRLVTTNPANTSTVLAVLEGGAIVRSNDQGNNWQKIQTFRQTPAQLFYMPEMNNSLIAVFANDGIKISNDDGNSWQDVNSQKTNSKIGESQNKDQLINNPLDKSLSFGNFTKLQSVVNQQDGSLNWLLIADKQLWLSNENIAGPYNKLPLPLQNEQNNILDVTYDSKRGANRILVSVDNKLIESTDRGQSWNVNDKILTSFSIGDIKQIVLDNENPEIAYLVLYNPNTSQSLF